MELVFEGLSPFAKKLICFNLSTRHVPLSEKRRNKRIVNDPDCNKSSIVFVAYKIGLFLERIAKITKTGLNQQWSGPEERNPRKT